MSKSCTVNLADDAFSLLRFYLNSYDSLKTEKRSLEKDRKFGRDASSKLFVPPVAPCRFKSVRGYRLCWSIGAIELFRSGVTSSKTTISAAFLRSVPSLPVLEKGWKSALSTLSRFRSKPLGTGAPIRFRVTALGLSRSSQAHLTDNMTTQFVATALGAGIKNAFGWTVDLENYDVEVVATLIKNATASRTTVVLSLGVTLLRATSAQCIAGLLARQRDTKSRLQLEKSNILKEQASMTTLSGSFIIDEIIKLSSKFDEPRVPWSLVRKVIKSDVFRRHYLNRSNSCGETPLILAAKACDSRLVSLILSLGKRKCKEDKFLPQPPVATTATTATTTTTTMTRPGLTQRIGLLKRDHRRYDALMYSCEQGDNSTLSVLLNHKTLTRGFSKLCERCLTVATRAGHHHTLSVILHYLLGIKGTTLHHSLCWPALSVAMQSGNSLTVALILDFMKMLNRKWKLEADSVPKKPLPYKIPPTLITISEEMLSTIFPRIPKAGSGPKTLADRYELNKPFFDSVLAVLIRAQVFVQGTDGGIWLGCLTHTIGETELSFPYIAPPVAAAPAPVCPEKLQFDAAGRRIRLAFYKKLLDQKVSTPERKLPLTEEDKYDSAEEKEDKDDSKSDSCIFPKEEDDDRSLLDDEKVEKKRERSTFLGPPAAVGGSGGVTGVAMGEFKDEDRHLRNKQKRPRGGSRLALYEKEKQRWMQHFLEIFQCPSSHSFLCASTAQIVLSYLHL